MELTGAQLELHSQAKAYYTARTPGHFNTQRIIVPKMDLLAAIQSEVLRQKEEEAVNLFSWVVDFRDFILNTRPADDVLVALKCAVSTRNDFKTAKRKPFIAQIMVWDAKPDRSSAGRSSIEFRPGTVYKFHQVELVGIYDGVAQGSVQLDEKHAFKVRQVGAHLKTRMQYCVVGPTAATSS
ncbi:hypothetical protein PF008_g293 [Phytophthora fragariae]|uniref:Uncharacterized protein n=2 Tax=Phytophthora fragariae TaxID=53985 RepID=A0A6G0SQF4_9STRA|nr:hypothetical protein PF008_g293 [Phytophthora fragariae]